MQQLLYTNSKGQGSIKVHSPLSWRPCKVKHELTNGVQIKGRGGNAPSTLEAFIPRNSTGTLHILQHIRKWNSSRFCQFYQLQEGEQNRLFVGVQQVSCRSLGLCDHFSKRCAGSPLDFLAVFCLFVFYCDKIHIKLYQFNVYTVRWHKMHSQSYATMTTIHLPKLKRCTH